MKAVAALIITLLLVTVGVYYSWFYPPSVMKRAARHSLQQFNEAVATKDRAKIGESLKTWLTDDAKIRLEVTFFSVTQQNPAVVQEFDKAAFITFIDNVLYPLQDYSYEARLESFALAEDRQNAAVAFSSKEWGDGNTHMGGISVNMRWSSANTLCEGRAAFAGEKALLRQATCRLTLMSVPKPGEANKIQGEVLKEYLTK